MKYIILSDFDHERLVKNVNDYIYDGWEPLGGVSFSSVSATWSNCTNPPDEIFQAMIKRGDE
jgi:hypothetical protein